MKVISDLITRNSHLPTTIRVIAALNWFDIIHDDGISEDHSNLRDNVNSVDELSKERKNIGTHVWLINDEVEDEHDIIPPMRNFRVTTMHLWYPTNAPNTIVLPYQDKVFQTFRNKDRNKMSEDEK